MPELGLADISLSLDDAMKRDGYLAPSLVADGFNTPYKTAMIVAVPTIFILDLCDNRDRQAQRQNLSHRLRIGKQRLQGRLIRHDGGIIRDP